MAAIISPFVPRGVVPSAMAWFASANQTGQIVGPALGGVLDLLGPTTVYGVTIVLWGLGGFHAGADAGGACAALRPSRSAWRRSSAASASCGTTASSPARCRSTCSRCSSAALRRCCRSSPATSWELGRGGWGSSARRRDRRALTMSIILARRPPTLPVGRVLFSVLTIYGLAVTCFAFSTFLWLSMAALAVMGAADVVSVVIRFARAATHAAADARQGQRGQWPVHWHLQPAWRLPRRRHGARCSGRCRRWPSAGSTPSWS